MLKIHKTSEKRLSYLREYNKRTGKYTTEEYRAYKRKYSSEHRKEFYIYQKRYRQKLRVEVLETLGSKCQKCGFSDIRALQIDHINGGGSKELKSLGKCGSRYTKFLMNIKNLGKDDKEKLFSKYQLLCANCNWIKRSENNECKNNGTKTVLAYDVTL